MVYPACLLILQIAAESGCSHRVGSAGSPERGTRTRKTGKSINVRSYVLSATASTTVDGRNSLAQDWRNRHDRLSGRSFPRAVNLLPGEEGLVLNSSQILVFGYTMSDEEFRGKARCHFRRRRSRCVVARLGLCGRAIGDRGVGEGSFLLIARRVYRPVRDQTYYSLSMRWRRGTAPKRHPPTARPALC